MATLIETRHRGGFFLTEYCPDVMAEVITLAEGQKLQAGTVVGVIVAGTVTDEVQPAGLVAGDVITTNNKRISSVVITDSAGSPATLTLTTDYVITDAHDGIITLVNVTGFTQPFHVAYAYAGGFYAIHNPAATDGTQDAAAILYDEVDATLQDTQAVIVARGPVAVTSAELVWFAGMTDAEKATALAILAGKFIIAR